MTINLKFVEGFVVASHASLRSEAVIGTFTAALQPCASVVVPSATCLSCLACLTSLQVFSCQA